jgi:hypothetical protein
MQNGGPSAANVKQKKQLLGVELLKELKLKIFRTRKLASDFNKLSENDVLLHHASRLYLDVYIHCLRGNCQNTTIFEFLRVRLKPMSSAEKR